MTPEERAVALCAALTLPHKIDDPEVPTHGQACWRIIADEIRSAVSEAERDRDRWRGLYENLVAHESALDEKRGAMTKHITERVAEATKELVEALERWLDVAAVGPAGSPMVGPLVDQTRALVAAARGEEEKDGQATAKSTDPGGSPMVGRGEASRRERPEAEDD